MLTGQPDLGAPVTGGGIGLFRPYGSGSFTVLPDRLTVPVEADGRPSLSLAIVRGAIPGLPPDPYAAIDLRLTPVYRFEAAVALAREHQHTATVRPFTVAGGFLRLRATAPELAPPPGFIDPVPLAVDGLDRSRFSRTMPGQAAALAERMLSDGTVPIIARAELEFPGVAARARAVARFDPAKLIGELATSGATVPRDELLDRFRTALSGLPIEVTAADPDPEVVAAAIVDRLRARYAVAAPAPDDDARAHLRFPDHIATGAVTWDLTEPILTFRPILLDFDLLFAVREYVAAHGTAELISRHVVPPLPAGHRTVTVTANLPPVRLGVLRLGVELIAPPRPPMRPQESRAEAAFTGSEDTVTARLRFAPAEPPEYVSVAYAVVPDGGNEPLRGKPVAQHGDTVRLGAGDFPIDFVSVGADPALLELSTVRAVFRSAGVGLPAQEALLRSDQPTVAFADPRPGGPGSLTLHVIPDDGAPEVTVGPFDASAATTLTAAELPGYGPQVVTVNAAFPQGPPAAVIAVDLIPEDSPEDPEWTATVALTPDRPERTWRYLPRSPFRPGFRWRRYRSAAPFAPWSDVRSPADPLTVPAGDG